MKFLHTAFLLLFGASLMHSQTLEVTPVRGNLELKRYALQKENEDAAFVEQMLGHPFTLPSDNDRSVTCPPKLDGNFVFSGDGIVVNIDTVGLMVGEAPAVLTILNQNDLNFGSAALNDTFLYLVYVADAGLTGAGTDIIQVQLSQPQHDTIVTYEINIRRNGKTVIAPTQTVSAESITTYCLANGMAEFAKPKACTQVLECQDNYDGAGQTIFHLSSYDYPDTCLVYYASRFPGVDTVCMRICDEWGVCDTFKIPYIIPGDTLSIATHPFFDDFSSYKGPYPTSDLWLDKDVYLNYTLAKEPPSVGFVTFDGLDRRGDVYNIVNDIGDKLTSKAINLSNYSPSDNIYLRFFLEPKGYGLEPDMTDIFKLEFRNNAHEWVTIATYNGTGEVPLDSFPSFNFYSVKLNDAQFFHKGFQFRFSSNTSPGGSVDLWHLDYVHLDKNVDGSDDFQDLAFTQLPNSLLKNYTAMPWHQFKGHVGAETTDFIESHYYNHDTETLGISASNVKYTELVTNTIINTSFPVIEGGADSNIEPKTPTTRTRTIPSSSLSTIVSTLDNIPPGNLRILETEYSIRPSAQLADFTVNDTVRLETKFSNYFAHDDGTAEWQVFINHASGNGRLATKFHANVADTMKAFQIMFPHVIGDVQDQLFNIEIYVGSLDTDPVLIRQLLSPYYPNNKFDTLQGFTTYVLEDLLGNATPVAIPADSDFFVSFQQASSAVLGIPIGFDIQNVCDCNYKNLTGGGWSEFSSNLKGSMMIRPVFSATANTNSASHEASDLDESPFVIFPNPTNGLVNFTLKNRRYEDMQIAVFNNLGQIVFQGGLNPTFDMSSFNHGVYHLQLVNQKTGETFSDRIILTKD